MLYFNHVRSVANAIDIAPKEVSSVALLAGVLPDGVLTGEPGHVNVEKHVTKEDQKRSNSKVTDNELSVDLTYFIDACVSKRRQGVTENASVFALSTSHVSTT